MRKVLFSIFSALLLAFAFEASVVAQGSNRAPVAEKCSGRIYERREVSRRPKFGPRESPSLTKEALAHGVQGRVVLSAVLCRTGKVTDVKIIEGLPFGVTEKAIEAARQLKFEPAEKNGQRVSEVIRLEYDFSYVGERRPPAQEPIAGRMIETVEISGLRSKQPQGILASLKTRPGQSYSQEVLTTDLKSLLALGFFDPKGTRVRVEEGRRGGINVIFEVAERQPD